MIFNSIEFLVFFVIVILFYSAFEQQKYRAVILVLSSYAFYAWNQPYYLIIIVFSTILDYTLSCLIYRSISNVTRKILLFTSLTTNLSLLFTFKYLSWTLGLASLESFNYISDLALPIGISFYTFQTMSYTIDVYRGNLRPENSLLKFSLYVSFFPQLVAGPIERATKMLPQISELKSLTISMSMLYLILTGFFRKMVLADNLGIYVDSAWEDVSELNVVNCLIASAAFSLQIYFDFSGYSRIARGLAGMFGIDLMVNFDYPYGSKSLREFWRRWHISLSTWFRDYVYFPLGGNRLSKFSNNRNLIIVFLVSGIWHGANMTFIVWGLLHGLFLILETNKGFGKILTWLFLMFTWIFFRSPSLDNAFAFIQGFGNFDFNFYQVTLSLGPLRLLFTLFIIFLVPFYLKLEKSDSKYLIPIMGLSVYLFSHVNETFIYFQF